jgi:hypothetical protein
MNDLGQETIKTPDETAHPATATLAGSSAGNREMLLEHFQPLFAGTGGIDSWLHAGTPQTVFDRLGELDSKPLTRAQLNQLLVLSHEAGMSDGFYRFYWLTLPAISRDAADTAKFEVCPESIRSVDQLRWGWRRFYIDGLLHFGNVRSAYRQLRDMSFEELERFFSERREDTETLETRGPALPLHPISRDDRYLISEMACKSLGSGTGASNLGAVLKTAYQQHVRKNGATPISVRQLLEDAPKAEHTQLTFTADAMISDELASFGELEAKINLVVRKFKDARAAALQNTKLYLSMVDELDVYVATSMRNREDFREVADFCKDVFSDQRLADLHVRYFDPTVSAAEGHEDKGLIECLMVKSAKALIYCAGRGDSYGKDAEAAMALSQGKPVILYCPDPSRQQFYRDVHPLARLIDFRSGVANGWMVVGSPREVAEILLRVLTNQMTYELEQSKPGYLRLKESISNSVVRLQTNDTLLRETFWNYYHRER